LTAPVRLHPLRVLSLGGARWEVPVQSHDLTRGRIDLAPARADHPDTWPLSTVEAAAREVVEAPRHVAGERLRFHTATVDAVATETVRGVRRADGSVITYAPVTARYRTRARLVALDGDAPPAALTHLAAMLGMVLPTHLQASEDDLAFVPVPAGWGPGALAGWPAGVLAVDRHPQGMGSAEALDPDTFASLLDWVWAIAHRCPCQDGCPACAPASLLAAGAGAKAELLAALGARTGTP
jgi:hypothetical protein